jgi:lipopolysaccharide export system protein LptA
MKFPCLVVLGLACGLTVLVAQTNAGTNGVQSILALVTTNRPPAAPATNAPAAKLSRGYIHLESAGPAVFDFNNHCATYSENVSVTNDQMKLTCEWIKAEFTGNWDQATNVVAETNVVVDYIDPKGQRGRAIGTNALYVFQIQNGVTNETITLTGDPPEILEGPNYTNHTSASDIVYDLITRKVILHSPSGTYWRTTNNPTGSNSAGADSLPSPK